MVRWGGMNCKLYFQYKRKIYKYLLLWNTDWGQSLLRHGLYNAGLLTITWTIIGGTFLKKIGSFMIIEDW